MKLLELIFEEKTKEYYFFNITIERSFLGFKTTKTYDCQRCIKNSQSRFISNGQLVFLKHLYLDDSINAILSKINKNYHYLNN